MRKINSLTILTIISAFIMMLGATFSYFNIVAGSDEGTVSLTAARIGIDLTVTPLYYGLDLVPMNDNDVMKAYEEHCIDDIGYGACSTYEIRIENTGGKATYSGVVNFTIDHIEHLNYLLLDEDDNVYVSQTAIESDTDQTLGDEFELDENEVKTFRLVVWLSNYDYKQDDEDAGGTFTGFVTYTNKNGSKVTGSFTTSG